MCPRHQMLLAGVSHLRAAVTTRHHLLSLFAAFTVACSTGVPTDNEPPDEPYDFGEISTLPGGGTMEFVWIEPGSYLRGSPLDESNRRSEEGPQHQVTLTRGFWLGKFEVTQKQWALVMDTEPWSREDHVELDDHRPAVYLSWGDVQLLLGALNSDAGESLYRLPTEAEWEFAARAGTSTPWSFADGTAAAHAWTFENTWDMGLESAQPGGTLLPNPWGLHDMHGNVYEWCDDWFGPYEGTPQSDPAGPDEGADRVARGGGFDDQRRSSRSAARFAFTPTRRFDNVGVRLVRIR